jgi:hypothetical protein
MSGTGIGDGAERTGTAYVSWPEAERRMRHAEARLAQLEAGAVAPAELVEDGMAFGTSQWPGGGRTRSMWLGPMPRALAQRVLAAARSRGGSAMVGEPAVLAVLRAIGSCAHVDDQGVDPSNGGVVVIAGDQFHPDGLEPWLSPEAGPSLDEALRSLEVPFVLREQEAGEPLGREVVWAAGMERAVEREWLPGAGAVLRAQTWRGLERAGLSAEAILSVVRAEFALTEGHPTLEAVARIRGRVAAREPELVAV